MYLTRRQFTLALGGAAAGLAAARCSVGASAAAEAEPFRLRYILSSCLYGYTDIKEILPEVRKTGATAIDIWPRVHGDQREQLDAWAAGLGIDAALHAPGRAFPWGGWYALRSAWGGRGSYLLLKACAPGVGHLHEDSLSLVLWCGGRRLLIDSGNFSYGSATELDRRMNAYGSAGAAHSVVLVDGHGARRTAVQAALRGQPWEEPRLRADAAARLPNRALAGGAFALVEGAYDDGFGPDAIAVRHRRQVLQVEGRGWLVIDRLLPADEAEHAYARLWQLPPEALAALRHADGRVTAPGLDLVALTPATIAVGAGVESPPAGWYFPSYGQRTAKPDVHLAWRGHGPQLALTWLGDGDGAALTAARCQAEAGAQRVELAWDDGGRLAVVVADGTAELAAAGCRRRGELLAVLGDEAACLADDGAQLLVRTAGGWAASGPWPALPEA